MKGALDNYRMRCLTILVVFCLAACWALPGRVWAVESSGLILSIHTDKNQYLPGEPVRLTVVLKYDPAEQQPVITKKGFSKNLELHRLVSITDPGGTTHRLGGAPKAHAMLPADYEDDQGREWRITETLGTQIPVSVTIRDLLALTVSLVKDASKIQNMTGWFTLRASISSYVRYDPQQTRSHFVLGGLGRMGAPENYVKPILSNTVKFYIAPLLGAQFEVQVLDQDLPAADVPVKVFRTSEIPTGAEPLDLWSGLPEAQPVLVGTTDLASGTIKQWEIGSACQQQDGYTVIAYYGGQFGQTPIQTTDDGWQSGCSGLIKKTIVFGGEVSPTVVDDFVTVSYSGVRYDRRTRLFSTLATLTNTSKIVLSGPVWLVIKNLNPDEAILTNAAGQIDGHFYIEVLSSGVLWQAGTTISNMELLFSNPTRIRITFDDEVRAIAP